VPQENVLGYAPGYRERKSKKKAAPAVPAR